MLINTESLKSEANELIKQGFESVGSDWRNKSRIESVQDFTSGLNTYAKMAVLTPEEIDNGEYRQTIIDLGRQAADKLTKMVNEVGSEKCCVTFLNGCEWPRVEVCQVRENGDIEIHGYYQFGVQACE